MKQRRWRLLAAAEIFLLCLRTSLPLRARRLRKKRSAFVMELAYEQALQDREAEEEDQDGRLLEAVL